MKILAAVVTFVGSGAAGVCIIRPADGALLGTIAPSEAIPDLLRVDEHCNVYVAEESGHLAAFGAMPRLTLVTGDAASATDQQPKR